MDATHCLLLPSSFRHCAFFFVSNCKIIGRDVLLHLDMAYIVAFHPQVVHAAPLGMVFARSKLHVFGCILQDCAVLIERLCFLFRDDRSCMFSLLLVSYLGRNDAFVLSSIRDLFDCTDTFCVILDTGGFPACARAKYGSPIGNKRLFCLFQAVLSSVVRSVFLS